jgi:phosphoribosylformylglycinamidine synthase
VHDLSDGGLAVALAEMALPVDLGAEIALPDGLPPHAVLFGEDQARYLVTAPEAGLDALLDEAARHSVPVTVLGRVTAEPVLRLGAGSPVTLAALRAVHEGALPALMIREGG